MIGTAHRFCDVDANVRIVFGFGDFKCSVDHSLFLLKCDVTVQEMQLDKVRDSVRNEISSYTPHWRVVPETSSSW